jgi:serine protease inhibitor
MVSARSVRFSLAVVSIACAAACHDTTGPNTQGPAGLALVQLPRALTAPEAAVRDAANTFSFALWGKVNAAQRDTNVFISPLSASFALGMTMNGTANATYDQMHTTLQFGTMPLADINAGYHSLIALLESLDPGVQMQVANAIWYRKALPVRQSFVDTTKADFDATVQGMDFSNTSATLAAINGWASTATNGKIPKVLDTIDSTEAMFLVNAIYFKGNWRSQFDPALTTSESFTTGTGAKQPVQLMHRTDGMLYTEMPTYQAVDLSYGDSAFTMSVLLPKSNSNVDDVAASLTPSSWQALLAKFASASVNLSLPKVKLAYARMLNPDLSALGMAGPLDCNVDGDFSRMMLPPYDVGQLCIDFVKQNTFVDINEQGTEAAAVTVVAVGAFTSGDLGPVVMRVDHPYIVVIRERLTGTVLFMGKVVSMP